jgi:beta-lactamase regulating signal transducer with metallopeptidase domain
MIALPAWLITNAIVVAGLYPVAWLFCRLCRARPAAAHLVWLVLMAKLVTPPLLYWPWSLSQLADRFTPAKAMDQPRQVSQIVIAPIEISPDLMAVQIREPQFPDEQTVFTPPAQPEPQPAARAQWNLTSVIFLLWCLGAGTVAADGLRAIWLQRRTLRTCQPAPQYLVCRINELARQLRICPPPALIRERLSMPVLCCGGRPRLLWPVAMSNPKSVARSDGVLAHELAHIKRRDHWIVYVELLVAIVCWWNPLFWLIRRQLHETRELACDALALAIARQPRDDYARELLAISTARHKTIALAPAFGAGLAPRHFLKRRLTMVFDDRVNGRTPAASMALLFALAAVALPALTLAQQSVDSSTPTLAPAVADAAESPFAQNDSSPTIPAPAFPTNGAPASATQNAAQGQTHAGIYEDYRAPATQNEGSPLDSSPTLTATTPITETTNRKLGRFDPSKTFQETALPNGGGTLRIRKNDDGTIDVELEQASVRLVPSHVTQSSGTTSTSTPVTNRPINSSPTTTPPLTGINTTAAAQPSTNPLPTLSSSASQELLVKQGRFSEAQAYPTAASSPVSSRDAIDKEMLKSDVDLAKINLEEKEVQLHIAQKDGSDPDRVRLAELALQRAKVELNRAELQLKKGISAGRR